METRPLRIFRNPGGRCQMEIREHEAFAEDEPITKAEPDVNGTVSSH